MPLYPTTSPTGFAGIARTLFEAGLVAMVARPFVNGLMPGRLVVAGFFATANLPNRGRTEADSFKSSYQRGRSDEFDGRVGRLPRQAAVTEFQLPAFVGPSTPLTFTTGPSGSVTTSACSISPE